MRHSFQPKGLVLMVQPGLYRDAFGTLHQVLNVVMSDETGAEQVLHSNLETGITSVCSLSHFEEVIPVDGQPRPRFAAMASGSGVELHTALNEVFAHVLSQAQSRRLASDGYAQLFETWKDQGEWAAINEASRQMQEVASNLEEVLRSGRDRPLPAEASLMLKGLPLLLAMVRQDIQAHEGSSCVADKTRFVVRLYFQALLGAPTDCGEG